MSTNVSNNIETNQVAFLRSQRQFPVDASQLSIELNKSYIDTANAVNNRTISIFPIARPANNGESWFITQNQKQQGYRQVFTFTTLTNIMHLIQVFDPAQFVRCFGTYTDGTNSYGLIYGSNVAIAGQVSFYMDRQNIYFLSGAGAPTVTSGVIILEWLARP